MGDAGKMRAEDITLSGRKVHFLRGGAGFPLLLLHSAWGDAAMSWAGLREELTAKFEVIAPDLPGFGQSSPLPDPSLAKMAQTLRELLDFLRLKRAAVAGNSFGAGVARQFAADFPEMTSRLILINGGHIPHLPSPFRRLASVPALNRRLRLLMRRASYSPQALRKSFADASGLPPDFFEAIFRNAPAYSSVVFDTFMNITAALPASPVPTYLIWGARDRLTPLSQARRLRKKIRGSLLISIEGAGHMPQLEKPREFVMALAAALRNAQ